MFPTTRPAPRPPHAAAPAHAAAAELAAPVRHRPPLARRIAALYRNTIFNPFRTDARHLRRSIASLAPFAGGRLLDVGAGERPYGRLFDPSVTVPCDDWRCAPAGQTALLTRHGLEIESLVPRGNSASAAPSMTAQCLLRAVGARRRP